MDIASAKESSLEIALLTLLHREVLIRGIGYQNPRITIMRDRDGAFFFACPLGLLVTRGYAFASLFQGSGGSSSIKKLFSDWKVERGIAQAKDVAMATKKNRIALKVSLIFVEERFDDVTIALIDAQGCARVQQRISGFFRRPVVEEPKVLMSLAGPALNLLKQARDLFASGKCEVFYTGSVPAPK
jgi:AsmA protein